MLGPNLLTRVEQGDHCIRRRIDAGEVRSFVQVAVLAREGEVGGCGWPAVLAGHDVLDVESKEPVIVLVNVTVLAPVACALSNELAKRFVQARPSSGRRIG